MYIAVQNATHQQKSHFRHAMLCCNRIFSVTIQNATQKTSKSRYFLCDLEAFCAMMDIL